MRTQLQPKVSQMFELATQGMDTAMQAGTRLQDEAMRWWAAMFQETKTIQGSEPHFQPRMSEIVPGARKNVEQYLMLFDHRCHRILELMRRAWKTGQSRSYGEAQQRMLDLWQASLGALESETQEMVQVNSRVMKTLSEAAGHSFEVAARSAQSGSGQFVSSSPLSAIRKIDGSTLRGKQGHAASARSSKWR